MSPLAFFRRRIFGKIVLPYFALFAAVSVLTLFVMVNIVTNRLEDKLREELAQGRRSAGEAMVTLEEQQLAVLRQMAFTTGVPDAIAASDGERLRNLLGPIAINQQVPLVDVFRADGQELLALGGDGLDSDPQARIDPSAPSWPPVARVLHGDADSLGDRFADIVPAPWGPTFVTAAPVRKDGALVGAVAVSAPLSDVSTALSQQSGSKGVTLYAEHGEVLASTIRASIGALQGALDVAPADAGDLIREDGTLIRKRTVAGFPYVEALGPLPIRGRAALLLGVSAPAGVIPDSGFQTAMLSVVIFCVAALGALLLGGWVAQLINRPVQRIVGGTERIRQNDLDFELPVETSDETGVLTAAFNDMTEGLRQRERARSAIERYMSPKVYDFIQSRELTMGGVEREITVLKTDIRGFTTIAERMSPEELVAFLNRYFERMVAPITKYDGEIDKYMGDSVLAKFGATEWYPDHARRAVLAMVEMIEACDALAEELRAEGKEPVRMGIGANTGAAVVGNIGSPERMELTIISDAVNTAQRIEELCKELGWDLLISEQTFLAARDVIEVGEPWAIQLRGQSRETLIYPVLGRKGSVSSARRQAYDALRASTPEPIA